MAKKPITVRVHILQEKIKKLNLRIKLIEAKIKYLRDICPHPPEKVKTWTSSDYKGGSDHHWTCNDCGLMKVT